MCARFPRREQEPLCAVRPGRPPNPTIYRLHRALRLQAILELPTVVRGHGGRWPGQRGQQPWSEFVDGEEFLETLLLVVLRARVSTSNRAL